MVKPVFTPDPAPVSTDPETRAWMERQFERIRDYWPEDLEDRLAALELQWPYLGGTWPIVDYASFRFGVPTLGAASVGRAIIARQDGIYYSTANAIEDFTLVDATGSDIYSIRTNPDGQMCAAADGTIYYSDDATTWDLVAGQYPTGTEVGVIWYADKWWFFGTNTGKPFDVKSTVDFVTFTDEYSIVSGPVPNGNPAANGSTILVPSTVGNFAYFHISSDGGQTWTVQNGPDQTGWFPKCVHYKNGIWMMGGYNGRIYTTSSAAPGATGWTLRRAGASFTYIEAFTGGGGRIFASVNGESNVAAVWSTDGIGWGTIDFTTLPRGAQGEAFAYDDELGWLWASTDSAKSSTNGVDWADVDPPSGDPAWAAVRCCAFTNITLG